MDFRLLGYLILLRGLKKHLKIPLEIETIERGSLSVGHEII